MSILWAGGEFDSFNVVPTFNPTFSTTSGRYDSNFSAGGMAMDRRFDASQYYESVPLNAGVITEGWFHAYMWTSNADDGGGDGFLYLRNGAAGLNFLRLATFSGSTTQFRFQYWNGSAWTTIGSAVNFTFNALMTFDIYFKIDNSAGEFTLYANGVSVASFTGDTDLFSNQGMDRFQIWNTGEGSSGNTTWSEMIVTDQSTIGMRLATIRPTGAGNDQQWTGTFADVDDVGVIDDANYISAASADLVENFALSNLSSVADDLEPVAIVQTGRIRKGATGPQNAQWNVRSNSANYFSGNISGLTTSFANYYNVWDDDPDGSGIPWTISAINALQDGLKSIA